ncbi:MAG: 50S ribosomal protein L13 [Spirochaetes bacterium]|nr:50S ribosomal protein L13 [Spirochaetota bacterium]
MKDTYVLKKSAVKRRWLLIDAQGKTLGRLASRIAFILKGKHRPDYTYNLDNGDYVVVINAEKVKLTGKKLTDKFYHYHTGYAGGIKEVSYGTLMQKKPAFVIERAVKGMLSHGVLGREHLSKLKVYAGPSHPHSANKPEPIEV